MIVIWPSFRGWPLFRVAPYSGVSLCIVRYYTEISFTLQVLLWIILSSSAPSINRLMGYLINIFSIGLRASTQHGISDQSLCSGGLCTVCFPSVCSELDCFLNVALASSFVEPRWGKVSVSIFAVSSSTI